MIGDGDTLVDLEFKMYDLSYKNYRVYLDKFNLFNYIDMIKLISPEFLMRYLARYTDKDYHRLTSKSCIDLTKTCINTPDFREYLRDNADNIMRSSKELYYDSLYALRNELLSAGFDFTVNELNGDDSRSIEFLLAFAKKNRPDLFDKYDYIFNNLPYSENTNDDMVKTDVDEYKPCSDTEDHIDTLADNKALSEVFKYMKEHLVNIETPLDFLQLCIRATDYYYYKHRNDIKDIDIFDHEYNALIDFINLIKFLLDTYNNSVEEANKIAIKLTQKVSDTSINEVLLTDYFNLSFVKHEHVSNILRKYANNRIKTISDLLNSNTDYNKYMSNNYIYVYAACFTYE